MTRPVDTLPARRAPWLPPARLLLAVFGPALAVLGLVVLIAAVDPRSVAYLTRDPAKAVAEEGCVRSACAYAGLLSNLGVLVFAVGAVVAGLAALLAAPGDPRRRLLAAASALTALVLVDDLFLVHDELLGYVSGRSQQGVILALGATALAFVVAFRRELGRAAPPGLLVLTALGFGLSLVVDQIPGKRVLLEDAPKFLGIDSWVLWLVLAAAPVLDGHRRAARGAEPADAG